MHPFFRKTSEESRESLIFLKKCEELLSMAKKHTNPQAPGQTKLTFQLSVREKKLLQSLCNKSGGIKMSEYCHRIIGHALTEGYVFDIIPKPHKPTPPAQKNDRESVLITLDNSSCSPPASPAAGPRNATGGQPCNPKGYKPNESA
jgi:hypothetical protein